MADLEPFAVCSTSVALIRIGSAEVAVTGTD